VRGGHKPRVRCARCGRTLSARSGTADPVAHKCPHKRACIWPAFTGRLEPLDPCEQCVRILARDANHEAP
jgi:hypothetical protein